MSSMQYNMGQMMFPDSAQRYLQTMGLMGMGIGIPSGSMQRPMMPFGSVLPYPTVVGPSPANLRPQLVPPFHLAAAVIPDQVRMNASNQQDPLCSSICMMGPNMTNMVQIPNLADPYHHYAPLHHLQVPSQVLTLHHILIPVLFLMLCHCCSSLPKLVKRKKTRKLDDSCSLLFF